MVNFNSRIKSMLFVSLPLSSKTRDINMTRAIRILILHLLFHKNILANIEMSASNSGVFVVVALVKNSPTNTDPSSRQHMKVVPHPPATTNTKIE